MAKTTFSTSDALTKKAWEEKLFRDSVKESYFSRFMSEKGDTLVHTQTELEGEKGDKITIGIRMRLTGAGVTSGTALVGNEERLTTYNCSTTLEQYRHAVRDDGAMSRQRAMFSITEESEMALRDWQAEKIDKLCFDELGIGSGASADPSKIFYIDGTATGTFKATGTAATAKSALRTATYPGTLSLDFISFIKTWAKTGGNRAYVPLRPVKVGAKPYYVLLCHPDALYNLRISSEFKQAMREAELRGSENPLFMGSTAIWDGVVIHEHENCAVGTDGGAGAEPWTKAVFMGAECLCWAWGERPEIVEEEFDYGNEIGHATNMIAGVKKTIFNSLDYGSLGVYLVRTNVSGQ